jgi:hypothetical protein
MDSPPKHSNPFIFEEYIMSGFPGLGGNSFDSIINMATQFNQSMPGGMLGQFFKNMMSNMLQGVIEDMAKKLGIPDFAKDIAQGAVASALGDKEGVRQNTKDLFSAFQQRSGASDSDMGTIGRELDKLEDLVREMISQAALDNMENSKKKKGGGGNSNQTGAAGANGAGGAEGGRGYRWH